MHMNLDPFLVDKIVGEVKSQGVFDQFRKDSMADVDTKPAYQNLRQRVEMSVTKFLSDQTWTSDLNKNQLREKLRKHITEAGFLDTGVERIVDQVVNPKISTIFQPKIEDIAYKYLGIEKPQPKLNDNYVSTNGNLTIKTDLLPTDLEAVSPDSDKITNKSESKEDLLNDSEDKNEEFESPPFEPIEGRPPSPTDKKEDSNHSQLSGISGLTSQDSVTSEPNLSESKPADASQESELSQVSSNSRLSIVTNYPEENKQEIKEDTGVDISENAQMPKFNENSNSNAEVGEPLHFDIKKEDIKFEGTDRSEKMDYQESKADLTQSDYVKMEVEVTDIKSESKFDDVSMESAGDAATNSDTQGSAISKNNDSEKELKIETSDISHTSFELKSNKEDVSCSSKDDSFESGDRPKDQSQSYKSSPKEQSRNQSSSSYKYKKHSKSKRSEKDKEKNENAETSIKKSSSSSRHSSSSSKDGKSSSESSRSKSDSKSRHSKDSKSSDKNDKKLKYDKEKGNKNKTNDDHSAARHKFHRRKSTDSNDGDSNKEPRKDNLNTKNCKESENLNFSTNFSNTTSGNSNGGTAPSSSDDKSSTTQKVGYVTSMKPVILDDLLTKESTNNVELMIGPSIISNVVTNRKSFSSSGSSSPIDSGISSRGDLKYFKVDQTEEENIKKIINKLTEMICPSKPTSKRAYIMNCDEEFEKEITELGIEIINVVSEEKVEIINKSEYVQEVDMSLHNNELQLVNHQKFDDSKLLVTNENDEFLESRRNNNKILIADNLKNGKRKRKSDDYYISYHVFTDEKVCDTSNNELVIDCMKYTDITALNNVNPKKIKNTVPDTNCTKISPNPSELSVSSKENEFTGKIKKNPQNRSKTSNSDQKPYKPMEKKSSAVIKASQRYSSEDLYKPRPVLSQRSRRRAIDTETI